MAFSLGMWWVSLPFIIKHFEGSDADVGYGFALHMGAYACGCLLTGSFLHHRNPKRIVLIGTSIMFLMALGLALVIALSLYKEDGLNPVPLVIGFFGCAGCFMSFFWPFLMGWLSTGHEGPSLNRRMGLFNSAWAGGFFISPLLGGYLVNLSPLPPLLFPVGCLFLCFIAVSLTRSPGELKSPFPSVGDNTLPDEYNLKVLPMFRWAARIALMCAMIGTGVIRTQMGLLFKYELSFPNAESYFGTVMMVLSFTNFAVLTLAGRCHFWHFRWSLLIGAQLLVIVSALLVISSSQMWIFILVTLANGLGMAFAYASHLYYGVSGSKRRSARMAVHEITLSLGMVIGSLMGGFLSENLGPYAPYWFVVLALTAGFLAQALIRLFLKPRPQISSSPVVE
jgi:MFS family permease